MRPTGPLRAAALALLLAGCSWFAPSAPPPTDPPIKAWPTGGLLDSAWLPQERAVPPPAGFGLYTVLLSRSADRTTLSLVEELFASTVDARESPIARENLNLVLLPVRDAAQASRTLEPLRGDAKAAAAALMRQDYDFGQAGLLLAQVCRAERGAAIARACGSATPDGPLLVTTLQPLDGSSADNPIGSRVLVLNLARTSPEAMREALSSFRRQVLRKDFDRVPESEAWRLWALNQLLDASRLLPGMSKAYTGVR